jgi:hypothetical protein
MSQGVADVLADIELDSLPTETTRELLRVRRAQAAREAQIASGRGGLASTARQVRHVVGRIRAGLGLNRMWGPPPRQLTEAFGDISRL